MNTPEPCAYCNNFSSFTLECKYGLPIGKNDCKEFIDWSIGYRKIIINKPIEYLTPILPNSNPFDHDLFHMGKELDNAHLIMYSNFIQNDYMIIVHKESGKRIKINLKTIFRTKSIKE